MKVIKLKKKVYKHLKKVVKPPEVFKFFQN